MQRNTLIAVVLSFLIVIAWSYFFSPKHTQETQRHEQVTQQLYQQGPEETAPAESESPTAIEPVPPQTLAEARDVVVNTPRLIATFTTLGGQLTSLRLPEYQSKLGGEVELIPQDAEKMQWPLALTFNDSAFGTRTESFIYADKLYDPSSDALKEMAAGLRRCAGNVRPGQNEAEIQQELDQCLPKSNGNEDLRSLVLSIASKGVPAEGGANALNERADTLSMSKILVFSHQMTPSLRLVKAFVFGQGYSFRMDTIFRDTGSAPLNLGRGQSSYSIGWAPGMQSSETSAKSDELVAVPYVEKDYSQDTVRKLKGDKDFPGTLSWIGLKRKYFFVALEPNAGVMDAVLEPLGQKVERVEIKLNMDPMKIEPGDMVSNSVRICAGPMLSRVLSSCGSGFGQILNFGFFDYFAKILLAVLLWFDEVVQNYGLAIILLTVVVRLGLFPLNQKSYRSMKLMQALQPKIKELQAKYKKNPQDMNRKMMELYRTNKVNPMGGCLPIAFQMPIFIALFQALRYAVELRGAHFLWITDLSEPDKLFMLNWPIHLPVNLLPLLVIVAMLIQQKMTPMQATGQSEAQQKMMQYMPVFFGFLFYNMPSGLTVYFLVSTVLGLVQQYFVQKAT
jgi:YidC/Oxa1 family membrane protein insertase